MPDSAQPGGRVMLVVGVLMLIASVLYLLLVDDPFPMWLVLGGAGLMFLGVGAAVR